MTKNLWKVVAFILIAVLIISCIVGANVIRTSYAQDNFPLNEKWSVHLDRSVVALTIVDDKTFLVRTQDSLNALDVKTGRDIWHQSLSWQGVPERAITGNEMVYVVDGKGVKAFNQADGVLIWQQPVYGGASALVMDVSKEVLVVGDGSFLNIYDATQGMLLRKEPACRGVEQAYISGNELYTPCDGVWGVNIVSGQDSWWEKGEGLIGYTGYSDGVMYYSPAQSFIVAFDLNHWKELWRVSMEIDGFERFVVSSDYLFFTDFSKLCVFKRTDGQELWCNSVSYPQNPTAIGETVYVFNGNQKEITAFELLTGKQIGKLKMTNFNFFTIYRQLMTSSNDILLFASGRDVFAFEK
jgi:outer membrane protein assembly factor BamB